MNTATRFLFLTILGALAIGFAAPRADARSSVSFDFFYNSLDPYGEWIETGDSGYVWHPRDVDDDWAPYTDGYWAYTDAGWTWVSYEDYGNITYHYGRWSRLHDVGWCWTPDYEWAPAWVSWRNNNDYVGWAPLPPEARFHAGISFGGGVDVEFGIGPGCYNFVGVRDFGSPALRPVIIDRSRNVTIIDNSRNVTNITYNDNRVFNGGPNFAAASRQSARPIQRLKLVQQRNAALAVGKKGFAKKVGNELVIPAPVVSAPTAGVKPRKIGRTIAQANVDKGWSGVTDPAVRERIQKKMQADARAPKGQAATAAAVTTDGTAAQTAPVVQPGKNGKGRNGAVQPGAGAQGQLKKQGKNANLKAFDGTEPATDQATVAPNAQAGKKGRNGKIDRPQQEQNGAAAVNARAKADRSVAIEQQQAAAQQERRAAIAQERNKQQRGVEMRSERASQELAIQRQRQAQQAEARQQQQAQQAQVVRKQQQVERPPQAQIQQRRAPQQLQPQQRRVQQAPQPKREAQPQGQPGEKKKKKKPQQDEV